jgi:hypothetical protein
LAYAEDEDALGSSGEPRISPARSIALRVRSPRVASGNALRSSRSRHVPASRSSARRPASVRHTFIIPSRR